MSSRGCGLLARQSLIVLLTIAILLPIPLPAQVPIDVMPVLIFEILDPEGRRLGSIVVAGRTARGFEEGFEYWQFSESALLEMADYESLELAVWARGEWDDPWVVDALGWSPEDAAVEWSHPAAVEWTSHHEAAPPLPVGGVFFGNATLGGLMFQYSPRGASSLTWFKLTEGEFMQLEDGAVLRRDDEPPASGSWWYGAIE